MPEDRSKCPACGLTVRPGASYCDYCGFEFEDNDTGIPQSPSFQESTRKTGGAKKNSRQKPSKPSQPEPAPPAEDPQDKIKKLQQQLAETEKELDEISKMLGPETQTRAPLQAEGAQATHQISRSVTINPPPLAMHMAATPHVPESKQPAAQMRQHARMSFEPTPQGLFAIIFGLIVYALAFVFSSTFTQSETLLMLIPGSVSVGVGLYFSFQAGRLAF